jgi:multicomponent Na+:H+ antiporter subunit C
MNHQLEAALLVAVLFGAGIYLCLARRFLNVLFGFLLISNGANLVLLAVSGDPTGRRAPVVNVGGQAPVVDPLPQALILTAIVIGMAVAAYLILLLYRLYVDRGSGSMATLFPSGDGASKGKGVRR